MTQPKDVYGNVLSTHLCTEIMLPTHVKLNVQLIHLETMIQDCVLRLVSLGWHSTEWLNIPLLRIQLHSVFINVLLVVGLTISHSNVLVYVVMVHLLTIQHGNVCLCVLPILFHMPMHRPVNVCIFAQQVTLLLMWVEFVWTLHARPVLSSTTEIMSIVTVFYVPLYLFRMHISLFCWDIESKLHSKLFIRVLSKFRIDEVCYLSHLMSDLLQLKQLYYLSTQFILLSGYLRDKLPYFPGLLLQIRPFFLLHSELPQSLLRFPGNRQMLVNLSKHIL